eukprot:4733808-Pyramimonas_sp.AAC.1
MTKPNLKFDASSRCRQPTKTGPPKSRTRSSKKRRQARVPACSGLAFPRNWAASHGGKRGGACPLRRLGRHPDF